MATDLLTRKTSSKSEAYLRRKFAELCARIKRVDLLGHLLTLGLIVVGYAFLIGAFDWFAGNSTATFVGLTRLFSYLAFLGLFGFFLVRTIRCGFQRVNPYYVAHQIEQSLPEANNSLINWLDLHDEAIPSAFQKTLSSRAAEQLEEADVDQSVSRRKNWILLASLGLPTLGLFVLLILGPSAFLSSMLRAFVPFYTPAPIVRTQITLMQPVGGDIEVNPTQTVTFLAKIDGRVPIGNRPDAPKLLYRYQADEDYLALPLQAEEGGQWSTQIPATQLRTGFTYKIIAGDAETPEHQVRVRARAHVMRFEITYHHRPFRKVLKTTSAFPNQAATRPIIHGPPGSEVELLVRASRPVKALSVEVSAKAGKKELFIAKHADDPQAFTCRWTLDQPGQFRVLFTADDGETNTDRDWHDIVVQDDAAPRVVLTQPGKDIELPWNGLLQLEGLASSDVGLKGLTLHMRLVQEPAVKLAPRPYRPEKSFKQENGKYPDVIEYDDFVPLDELKNDKGTIHLPAPGTVLEYWLEAVDCADHTKPAGIVGKSAVYKVTLTPTPIDSKLQQAQRSAAASKQNQHYKNQDDKLSQKNTGNQPNQGNGPGQQDPQKELDKIKKDNEQTQKKLDDAAKQEQDNKGPGQTKSADQQTGASKPGPDQSSAGQGPQKKDQGPKSPDDAGSKKDDGGGKGSPGEAKDDGAKKKSPKDGASKGERKDGPKDSPSSAKDDGQKGKAGPSAGAKDAGPMGMDTPMQPQAKNNPGGSVNAPKPSAKQGSNDDPIAKDGPPPANAKGVEHNGPDVKCKDPQTASNTPPPGAQAKSSKMNDPAGQGDSKQGPQDPATQPSQARGDESKGDQKGPGGEQVLTLIEQSAKHGAEGDKAGKELADIAKNADDQRLRDLAKDALQRFGRDPKTGLEEKKGPSPIGMKGGKSPGISDDVKATIAKREFAARIGQMQLDDWQKRMTPDLLKKAGLTQEEWQRYVQNMQSYDALVRQLNARLVKDALKKELRGAKSAGMGLREIEGGTQSSDPLGVGQPATPPELRDPLRRFTTPRPNP